VTGEDLVLAHVDHLRRRAKSASSTIREASTERMRAWGSDGGFCTSTFRVSRADV